MTTWGFYSDGTFIPLPIAPMRHLGPPPFSVTLPSGELREVVEGPSEVATENENG